MKVSLLNSENTQPIIKTLSISIVLLAYVALIARSFLSVELTDEAYSVAGIYNASFGKIPFADIWDPHPGWFLYVPFLNFFRLFSPNLRGCILYFRIMYFLFATIVLVGAYKLNKRRYILPIFACVGYVSFSLPQMGHNAGVSYLLILASCLLIGERGTLRHFFCLGIIMGIACILYPTVAILAIVLIVPILHMAKWKPKSVFAYCGGVALVGFIFLLWILIGSKSIDNIAIGIKETMTTPHETNKGAIDIAFLQRTFSDRLNVFYTTERTVIWLVHGIVALIIKAIACKENGKGEIPLLIEYLSFIILATAQIYMDSSVQPISRGGYVSYTVFGGLLYYIALNRELMKVQIKLLIFIVVGWILTYCFSSDNKNVFFAFDAAGTLVFFASCYTVATICNNDSYYIAGKAILTEIAYPATIMVIGISCFFGYVYRDAAIGELRTKVNYGIYAGLYTTEENAKYVENLEHDIEVISADYENIFVANNMPSIYLMSKIKPFTPQAWDAQFLARGYTSAAPVLSYFESKREKPELIVMNNHLLPNLYSMNDAEIWKFIDEYYKELLTIDYSENDITKIWILNSD